MTLMSKSSDYVTKTTVDTDIKVPRFHIIHEDIANINVKIPHVPIPKMHMMYKSLTF